MEEKNENALKGAGAGATVGAAAGSVIPGVGTAIGAGVGGVIGGALGYFGSKNHKKKAETPYNAYYGGSAQAQANEQHNLIDLGNQYGVKQNTIANNTYNQGQAAIGKLSSATDAIANEKTKSDIILRQGADQAAAGAMGLAASGRGNASAATLQRAIAGGIQAKQRAANDAAVMQMQEQEEKHRAVLAGRQAELNGGVTVGSASSNLWNTGYTTQMAARQQAEDLELNRIKVGAGAAEGAASRAARANELAAANTDKWIDRGLNTAGTVASYYSQSNNNNS